MRPSRFTKKWLYTSCILLTLSGILWLIGHYFLEIQGEFGPEQHPLEIWSLRLHGLFALFGTLCMGMLLEHHIKSHLKRKHRWWTGIPLLLLSVWLILSGYMLYYLSEEDWRYVFTLGHWSIGLVSVVVAWSHIVGKFSYHK